MAKRKVHGRERERMAETELLSLLHRESSLANWFATRHSDVSIPHTFASCLRDKPPHWSVQTLANVTT